MTEEDRWTSEKAPEHKQKDNWERKLVTDLANGALREQRRARRWGIFFKLLGFAYITLVLFTFLREEYEFLNMDVVKKSKDHTAVVDLYGVIATDQRANANDTIKGLQNAFKDENTKAVLLRINSPGGSPVQSGVIYDEMIRLRKKYSDIPLYAVIEDTCASGGYYIASAADEIFADKASLVGSIGVRMDGFGFVGAMQKVGVERRLLTAGENKALLDPFSPFKDNQKAHLSAILDTIHQQFIDAVNNGRGDRLKQGAELYSGLVWSGEQALALGLVDALKNERDIAREIVGAETRINFTPKEDLLDRFTQRLGASFGAMIKTLISDTVQLQN